MEDLSILVNAKLIDHFSYQYEKIEISDLGTAKQVSLHLSETKISIAQHAV